MHDGIGSTLREARNRRKVDLTEVEAATKIRLRYLRAMENEEWDVLPGGPYTRGFIRTYGAHLGLDGERLAEEYSRGTAIVEGERPPRSATGEHLVHTAPGRSRGRRSGRTLAIAVSLGLVAVLVAIGLLGEGGGGLSGPGPEAGGKKARADRREDRSREFVAQPGVALQLAATAEVWVCLLDAAGEPLIDGAILEPGAEAGPFRAEGFTVAFGNGEVELTIDGDLADTPPSASPVGYEIESGGGLTPLEEGERPDCT